MNKGFTLIELLAVIIVLSILTLVAFSTISNLIDKSNKSQEDATKERILAAAEDYVTSYNPSIVNNLSDIDDEYNLDIDLLINAGLIGSKALDVFDKDIYVKIKVGGNYKLQYYIVYGSI